MTAPDPDPGQRAASEAFGRLHAIVRRLRAPDGCAWDREQSPRSLRASLVEETWEAVSAIDDGDDVNLREELGDLYLLVTLLASMREEAGAFTVAEVLDGICEKLLRRHPHVFGDAPTQGTAAILEQWDRIKRSEKGKRAAGAAADAIPSVLDRLPGSLPPLERGYAAQQRAAKVGFDWTAPEPVWEKLDEEVAELRDAVGSGDGREIEEEVGDLLFTVINLSRQLKVDPSLALRATVGKFERRFRAIEGRLAERGIPVAEAGLELMDAIWNQLKDEEASASK